MHHNQYDNYDQACDQKLVELQINGKIFIIYILCIWEFCDLIYFFDRDDECPFTDTMKCSKESCGAEIADGATFCGICRTQVVVTTTVKKSICPKCNHVVLESNNFCPNCGLKVDSAIFTENICRGVQENGEKCSITLTLDAKFCQSCRLPTNSKSKH